MARARFPDSRRSTRTPEHRRRAPAPLLLALLLLVLPGVTFAALRPDRTSEAFVVEETRDVRGRARKAMPLAGELSLDAAVDLVQRRYNAKVVRADVSGDGPRRTYVLRLLSADGRVWTVRVSAATGAISE